MNLPTTNFFVQPSPRLSVKSLTSPSDTGKECAAVAVGNSATTLEHRHRETLTHSLTHTHTQTLATFMERDAGLEGVKDDDDGSTYHSNNNNNNKRTEGSGGCGRKRHWVWAFAMYASSTIRSTMGFTTPRVVGSRWYPRARSVSTTGGYQKTRFQQQQQQQQQQHDSVVASSSSSSWEPLTTTDAAMWMPNDCWTNYLDVQLPEGRCVGVQLLNPDPEHPDALTPENMARPSHWIHAMFHPQEVAYAVSQPKAHGRDSFLVGRLAMREALRRHDPATTPTCSILKDEYGRPLVPHGYLGSISHKQNIGVALVMTTNDSSDANSDDNMLGIGVDIERTQVRRMKIASKVLTPKEMGELGRVEVRCCKHACWSVSLSHTHT